MTSMTFPRVREDGAFRVVAMFSTSDAGVVDLIRTYLAAWTRANQTWIRIWRSDSIVEERLEFFSEFTSEPSVESSDAQHFSIVLEGRPSAARWKDWTVRMIDDLTKVFPEVSFERFES